MGDSSRDFWREVSHCKTITSKSTLYVDGVHGDASIAKCGLL